jgi:hypothetical protein
MVTSQSATPSTSYTVAPALPSPIALLLRLKTTGDVCWWREKKAAVEKIKKTAGCRL